MKSLALLAVLYLISEATATDKQSSVKSALPQQQSVGNPSPQQIAYLAPQQVQLRYVNIAGLGGHPQLAYAGAPVQALYAPVPHQYAPIQAPVQGHGGAPVASQGAPAYAVPVHAAPQFHHHAIPAHFPAYQPVQQYAHPTAYALPAHYAQLAPVGQFAIGGLQGIPAGYATHGQVVPSSQAGSKPYSQIQSQKVSSGSSSAVKAIPAPSGNYLTSSQTNRDIGLAYNFRRGYTG